MAGPVGLGTVAARAPAGGSPFDEMYRAPASPSPSLGTVAAQPSWGIEADVNPTTGVARSGGMGSAAAFDMARLDQALDEEERQRAAAAEAGPAALPPSALQSALAEREGELEGIYGALATPMRRVSFENPMRPIVERDAQNFYGGGPLELQPFVPPPPEPGEDEWAYMQRVQQLQAEDEQRQIAGAAALGDPRDIGKSGNLGMAEAQRQAVEGEAEAEIAQAERVAEVQRRTAEASRQATEEARAADEERRNFARLQRDAIEQAQAVQADARERLQALPELDPNRTFKSMNGGAKFWAILGSLAGGAIGSNEVPNKLMDLAARDLEAQKANAAQVLDAAASADAGVAQQTGLYRDLLNAAGDEAAADAMFMQMQLEDAARELNAQLAETTVPKLRADLQASLVGLEQQIDAQQRTIDLQLATTPEKIVKTFDPLGRRTRDLLMKRAERIEKERTDFQKMGVEGEGKVADRAAQYELESMKQRGAIEAKRVEKQADVEKDIKDKTLKWGQVETMIDDLLASRPGEMYTVGIPGMGEKGQRIEEEQFFRLMPEILTTAVTGAVASPEQKETFNELISGDWSDWTDEDRRARLRALKGLAGAQRRYMQNQLGSERREVFDAKREVGSFRPE